MNDGDGKKGVKINLTPEEIDVLNRIAEPLRQVYRTEKLGAATIAAIIVARVIAEHPDLMEEWFGKQGLFLEPRPKAQIEPPEEKQAAKRKRK